MHTFLEKFGLQPHHLPANAFTTLSALVSFAESYLGLWPTRLSLYRAMVAQF